MISGVRRFQTRLSFVLAVALLTATSCGGSNGASTTTSSISSAAITTVTSVAPETTLSTIAQNQISASLTEYKIALSQSVFVPGTYTFIIKNNGVAPHALAITGPEISNQQTAQLEPGQSAQLVVALQGGTYDLWSPIGSDKSQGMNEKLTVGVIGHSAGS